MVISHLFVDLCENSIKKEIPRPPKAYRVFIKMSYILDTSRLTFEGDFNTQVTEIIKYIRLNKYEVERLQILFDELQKIFDWCWKGSQINVFGSILTGLAIKNSDVDIWVSLPPWYNQSSVTFVTQAAAILHGETNFQNITAIKRAKVPIVKFYHKPTQRYCDISFSGPTALKNSLWLEYMISLDKRILPLSLIVKYWSKVHGLTDTNLMSNYCLILLVVFYLQQKKILPSVILLQQQVNPDYTDYWNTAFNKINHATTNKESLYELLGGFFQYYCDFKFDAYILSLYTGKLIERTQFANLQSIPEEFKLYCANVKCNNCNKLQLNTLMCVQDAFNHSRNVGVAIYFKLFTKIMAHFKTAATLFQQENQEDYLRNLLHTKDSPVPPPHRLQFKHVPKRHGFKKNFKHCNPRSKNMNDRNFKRNFKLYRTRSICLD